MSGSNLSVLRGKVHACAVKGSIFDYPWSDVGFGLDLPDLNRWWKKLHTVKLPVYWAVPNNFTDARKSVKPSCLQFLRRNANERLSDDPGLISGGGTSGFGALNLAYLKRARLVVLFGYDYGAIAGKWHANAAYYHPRQVYDIDRWIIWARAFDNIIDQLRASGTEVINASPSSNIAAFQKVSVEEGIQICSQ